MASNTPSRGQNRSVTAPLAAASSTEFTNPPEVNVEHCASSLTGNGPSDANNISGSGLSAPARAAIQPQSSTSRPNDSRSKKRKMIDDAYYEVLMQRSNFELRATYDAVEAAGWRPSTHHPDRNGASRLQSIDPRAVIQQYRKAGPSVLETPDGRVNWCVPDPTRAVATAYCGKILADRPSAEALVKTMLDACDTYGGQYVNFRFEVVTPRVSKRHRQQVAKWGEEAEARKVAARNEASDAGAPSPAGQTFSGNHHYLASGVEPETHDDGLTIKRED